VRFVSRGNKNEQIPATKLNIAKDKSGPRLDPFHNSTTKGVSNAATREKADAIPSPEALTLVGYTSGV